MVLLLACFSLILCFIIEPLGLAFRSRLQAAVASLNASNQSLLTQVAWVNELGRDLGRLEAANAGLAGDLERVEVRTVAAVPWLEKFRAD